MKKSIKKALLGTAILLGILWVGCEDASGVEGPYFFVEKAIGLAVVFICGLALKDEEDR